MTPRHHGVPLLLAMAAFWLTLAFLPLFF